MMSARRNRTGTLREAVLPAFLGVVVLVMIVASLSQSPPADARSFDSESAAPDGTSALRLWLTEMGYTVEEVGSERFDLPAEARLLFAFPGERPFADVDVEALRDWVESGGTAVLVTTSSPPLDNRLATGDAGWDSASAYATVRQGQPLLPEAGPEWAEFRATSALDVGAESHAVVVTRNSNGDPASSVMRLGEGWIWLLGPAHLLTNEFLRDPNQAAVATAVLRGAPAGATVLFDDYHLRGAPEIEAPIASLQDWLYRSAPGRALLFGLGILALFWVLAGRRLGPPLVAREELRRREAAEYVLAMASLKRRARALGEVANQRRLRLKAALGRRGHVDTAMDDADFVRRLGREGVLDAEGMFRVGGLLATLSAATGEQAVLKAAAEADAIVARAR